MIPIVSKALEKHREREPGAGFIFSAGNSSPVSLQNLARRAIVPALQKAEVEQEIKIAWHGWHAFRRGLATNLYRLGVPDKSIQAILRHANVNTTLTMYVKSVPADSRLAIAAP